MRKDRFSVLDFDFVKPPPMRFDSYEKAITVFKNLRRIYQLLRSRKDPVYDRISAHITVLEKQILRDTRLDDPSLPFFENTADYRIFCMRTMGVGPAYFTGEYIDSEISRLGNMIKAYNEANKGNEIPEPQGSESEKTGDDSLEGSLFMVSEECRDEQDARCFLMEAVKSLTGPISNLLAMPADDLLRHIHIEFVEDNDLPWLNWVSGDRDGFYLRCNTKRAGALNKSTLVRIAVHELAGHAAHMMKVRDRVEQSFEDDHALMTTLVDPYCYGLEGLADTLLYALCTLEPVLISKLDPTAKLWAQWRHCKNLIMNNSRLALLECMCEKNSALGRQNKIDGIVKDAKQKGLLTDPEYVRDAAQLWVREGLKMPYLNIYGQAVHDYMTVMRSLNANELENFMRGCFSGHTTPRMMEERYGNLLAQERNRNQIPFAGLSGQKVDTKLLRAL